VPLKRSLERRQERDRARRDKDRLAEWLASEPKRYAEWLETIFGVFKDCRSIEDARKISDSISFPADSELIGRLYLQTFTRSGQDLAEYSDLALASGLRLLLESGASDFAYLFSSGAIPIELHAEIIRAFSHVYSDCLQSRVAPMEFRGGVSPAEPGAHELHSLCYMIWDISSLGYCSDERQSSILIPVHLAGC
jgi:hypothetical protein